MKQRVGKDKVYVCVYETERDKKIERKKEKKCVYVREKVYVNEKER